MTRDEIVKKIFRTLPGMCQTDKSRTVAFDFVDSLIASGALKLDQRRSAQERFLDILDSYIDWDTGGREDFMEALRSDGLQIIEKDLR